MCCLSILAIYCEIFSEKKTISVLFYDPFSAPLMVFPWEICSNVSAEKNYTVFSLRCDGIFNDQFIKQLLPSPVVKKV